MEEIENKQRAHTTKIMGLDIQKLARKEGKAVVAAAIAHPQVLNKIGFCLLLLQQCASVSARRLFLIHKV